MSAALGKKVLCLGKETVIKQAAALSSLPAYRKTPLCATGSPLLSYSRHYRSQPTHLIGRYKYLLPQENPKKKQLQMKEINPGTDYEYSVLNIQMTGYDVKLVEQYAQYVHKLCNRFSVKVEESYAMPTKSTEISLSKEQGSKMSVQAVLTTHQRVVQVSCLSAAFAPILLEVLQKNQPEGVQLLVKEHTEADFKVRLKARPELEDLIAQLN
uniref:Large ribosomal subunit protein mL48 n=1 Tax=Sphenodon punctatus TaxID=8508 RepID=A0A8D0HMB1_SPHPU